MTQPRTANPILAQDVMSPEPVVIDEAAMAPEAEQQMAALDIRHLPVVSAQGALVGMLSQRDLLRARHRQQDGNVPIKDLMTPDVQTVKPQSRASEAAAILLDNKFGALPVVDDNRALKGLITETDFLRIAYQALGGDIVEP